MFPCTVWSSLRERRRYVKHLVKQLFHYGSKNCSVTSDRRLIINLTSVRLLCPKCGTFEGFRQVVVSTTDMSVL